MKVLITGGAGFIGSHLYDELITTCSVCILDNLSTGSVNNVTESPRLVFFEGDISNKAFVLSVFDNFQPDIVIHGAASYRFPDNWEEDIKTNITGTVNVIQSCRKFGVKKVIYLQTSLCYGITTSSDPVTLGQPLFSGGYQGGSSYAVSKTTAELYLLLSGLNVVSLRLANIYGPRNLSGPIPTFFKVLSENRKCIVKNTRRDFVYVSDLVNCIVKVVKADSLQSGIYHVSTGHDYPIREVFETVAGFLGKEHSQYADYQLKDQDDASTILLDSSQTTTDLGWSPQVDFRDGIRETLSWYRENQISETYTHLQIQNELKS